MASSDALRLQTALLQLHRRALQDHRLQAELARARREFFGVEPGVKVRPTAELRFLEWALLERESLALASIPSDVLAEPGDDDALTGSAVGVYTVESVEEERVDARDLQDEDTVELLVPQGTLQIGDLMVGRIYGTLRGTWQPSAAVAIYRPGAALAKAFQRDLKRLELERRLTQVEIEHLLLRQQTPDHELAAPDTGPTPAPKLIPGRQVEHIEAELETVLSAGGVPGLTTEVSDSLAQTERMGAVTGPLLEQLAFETEVDLDRARRLLIELWNAHHSGSPQELSPEPAKPRGPIELAEIPGETLGERLARLLNEGLSQKRDVTELFRQLEAMAGIEDEEEGADDDALGDAGPAMIHALEGEDFGDLAPLVTEYLWETAQSGSEAEGLLQLWIALQQNAALPHTNLDDVTGQDLMRLLLHVYLRAEPTGRAAAVRTAFAAVTAFSVWAEATQELSLKSALLSCQGHLLDHLDRLQEVGIRLTTATKEGASTPGLLHVEDIAVDGFGVRGDESSHWIETTTQIATLLRHGDLLLAALVEHGTEAIFSGPVVALPADAEALVG
jgi:hypothetical protein